MRCFSGARHPRHKAAHDALAASAAVWESSRRGYRDKSIFAQVDRTSASGASASSASRCTRTATPGDCSDARGRRSLSWPVLSSRLGAAVVAGAGPGAPRVADASVVLFDEGRGPRSRRRGRRYYSTSAREARPTSNSPGRGGTGERLNISSPSAARARGAAHVGPVVLSLGTSSCVIYVSSGGATAAGARVIRGVICGLS